MSDDYQMYGQMPVGRLFLKCAVPGMIAMLIWSICSLTDGIFVGNLLGSESLAAMSIAFPLIVIFTSLSDMIASGSSVRISICLGTGQVHEARVVFTNALLIILGLSFVFMLIGSFAALPILKLLGAEGHLAVLGAEYLLPIAALAPLCLLFFATDNYLRICGKVNYSLYVNVAVAGLNILLDALFMAGFGWGLWSAALATSLAISAGAVASLLPFLRRQVVLQFTRGRIDRRTAADIVYNGSSTFFNSVAGSLFVIFANYTLLDLAGAPAVAAFAIMTNINSIVEYLFDGMSESMQPAVSYNYGAGNQARIRKIVRLMAATAFGIAAVAAAAVTLGSSALVQLFIGTGDPTVTALATHGMPIITLSFLFSWVAVVGNTVLTAVDRAGRSLTLGLLSQLIVPVGLMASLAAATGLDGVWWSIAAAAAVSAIITAVLMHGVLDRASATRRT